MLKKENNYDFRKRICKPHKRVYRNKNERLNDNEYEIKSGVTLSVENGDTVAQVALRDFKDYLKTAFGINASIVETGGEISARVATSELGENSNGYMGRKTCISQDGIKIEAFDMRGIAQALYALEERMNTRKAPFLKHGTTEERPAFSPRMVHSGYGLDQFPDEYLSTCAHHGYDAILAFVKDANHSAHGECDFNDIVKRAAKYGIDVYAYSYIDNFVHPCAEGAKEIYQEIYGGLFRDIKGLRGIVFVGESIEFPSRDPNVVPRHYDDIPESGIPDGKITPGWWPCEDYPEWITLIRDSVRAESPDADIVFWTYNFGYVEEKYRVKLLRKLPADISLLLTFEMFDKFQMGEGIGEVMDYTISHTGPSRCFLNEAEVAAERGIRLYSQVNTAGRTWDFGVVPYNPFPDQWNRRHEKIFEAREKYGLSGLMESHHYGFLPSFISRIAKNNFTLGALTYEEKLLEIAKEYADDDYEKFIQAMRLISDSVTHYVPSDENQYGPFRIGPAYPLCIIKNCKKPNDPGAHFGNWIYSTLNFNYDSECEHDPYSLRIRAERAEMKKARDLLRRGLRILKTIKNKTAELERLINLIVFIEKCYNTGINVNEFYVWRNKLLNAENKDKLALAIKQIEKIAKLELKNALSTIPVVERDSSIGFEASMLYQCDRRALEWKIEHLMYMIDVELNLYRRAIDPESVKGRYFRIWQ